MILGISQTFETVSVCGEPLLERFEEQLLAAVAVDVGIEVPEPDVGERVRAVELLIARVEVDRRCAGVRRDEVAAVDVEVDAVDAMDDLREGVEVEGDQVVDRYVRQVRDRVQRGARASVGAAIGPRGVDPVVRGDGVSLAVDRDVEVAREREE